MSTPASVAKRLVLGRPMATGRSRHTLLPKTLALSVLSPDPLSSVAYSLPALMGVLVVASGTSLHLAMPISVAISLLMVVVVASYRQTVRAYITSGGAYVVAGRNLGVGAALLAGSALVVGYILTVAVSISSGVLAIISVIPSLQGWRVSGSLIFVAILALVNLRGIRESGISVAGPTYAFIAAMYVMIIAGLGQCTFGTCPHAAVPSPVAGGAAATVGAFVILKAFVQGSAGMTGVEATSNAVTAFRRPQGKNAAAVLLVIGVVGSTLLSGMAYLAVNMGARPSNTVSLISEIARATFPSAGSFGFMFYVVQFLTFAMLVLAANTSYTGFPRLAAVIAHDGYLPRQFENLGDRLVYSNGILVLSFLAALLIWFFKANLEMLVPIYIIGVFTAFTLSQLGMVHHWLVIRREGGARARGWPRLLATNALGAFVTGVIVIVALITSFTDGAWIVMVAVPVMLVVFFGVHRHYARVARELSAGRIAVADEPINRVVLYVQDLGPATRRALGYVRTFRGRDFRAVHVPGAGDAADLTAQWARLSPGVDLEVLPNRGDPRQTVISFAKALGTGPGEFVTVVVPETLPGKSLLGAIRLTTFRLKSRLMSVPGVVVTDVPIVGGAARDGNDRALPPHRIEALVLVSRVDDATVRAVNYARALRADSVRAVSFALDAEDVQRIQDRWGELGMPVPLDIVDAPFRELDGPVLNEVRRITRRPGTLAAVVVPEVVVGRWWSPRHLLHGQRVLFIKRLLLFEDNVILSSVPYRLH